VRFTSEPPDNFNLPSTIVMIGQWLLYAPILNRLSQFTDATSVAM
jgi:hypothetical protein